MNDPILGPEPIDASIHVYPHDDSAPHVLSGQECWCNPYRDEEEPSVVIHVSADGRELRERGL